MYGYDEEVLLALAEFAVDGALSADRKKVLKAFIDHKASCTQLEDAIEVAEGGKDSKSSEDNGGMELAGDEDGNAD